MKMTNQHFFWLSVKEIDRVRNVLISVQPLNINRMLGDIKKKYTNILELTKRLKNNNK